MTRPKFIFKGVRVDEDSGVGFGRTRSGLQLEDITRRWLDQRNYLQLLRVNMTNWRLADGSGLSLADRLTTQGIVSLLNHVRMQSYAFWFRNSLPTAGVSGTLKNRMRTGPAHGNARAKTGTLRDASALSGYVTSANGHTILFSMIMNHAPDLDITRARALQDRVVQLIAGSRPA